MERIHCRTKKMLYDLCPKCFYSKSSIRFHMQVHSRKKFACNVCDYKTSNKSCLKSHRLSHNEKVACPESKKEVTSLNEHMKTHKNARVSCSICHQTYLKRGLKNHIETVHQIRKCENCDSIFRSKADFKK